MDVLQDNFVKKENTFNEIWKRKKLTSAVIANVGLGAETAVLRVTDGVAGTVAVGLAGDDCDTASGRVGIRQ